LGDSDVERDESDRPARNPPLGEREDELDEDDDFEDEDDGIE